MADSPPDPDSNGDTGAGSGSGPTNGTPRWVYAFGIIALVLALLFAALRLTGHGLGGHTP